MKIELKEITVAALINGYEDNEENGVLGYGGKLDIRPPYQREFVYGDKERKAVIDTVQKDFPLNVMYWAVRKDGGYEVIDGQQRTISVCQYVNNDFSVNGLSFENLTDDKKEQILDYKLMVYFCSGKDSEKLAWFETINIAGKQLTKQELRNAVYSGSWVSDAKRYFSKNNRPKLGDDYMSGSANRQEYLETAIDWISDGDIESYMSKNQHESNANELWPGQTHENLFWFKSHFKKTHPVFWRRCQPKSTPPERGLAQKSPLGRGGPDEVGTGWVFFISHAFALNSGSIFRR